MFSEFSGGQSRGGQSRHGADLRYDLDIDLMKRFQDVPRTSSLIFLRLVSFAPEAVRKKVASLLPVLGAVDAVRCALSKVFHC